MGRSVLVFLCVFLSGMTACGREVADPCLDRALPPAEGPWVRAITREGDRLRVTTEAGRVWDVPGDPRRIVSMLPGITETLAWLGGGHRLVAVSDHCDEPPEVRELPAISVMPIAYEQLIALSPDLLLVDATLLAGEIPSLAQRVAAVLPLESRSLADLETSVEVLAEVLDTGEARGRALRFERDLAEAIRGAALPAPRAPRRVLLLAQAEPLFALGPGSLLDDMLRTCGALNIACDLGRASGPFAAELVRTRRPDWILVTGGEMSTGLLARWAEVPAVAAGHVGRADADDLVRAGPRTPEALGRLAAVLRGTLPPEALERPR